MKNNPNRTHIIKKAFSVMLLIGAFVGHGVSQDFEEIRPMGDSLVAAMTYVDDDRMLMLTYRHGAMFVQEMDDNGQVLSTVNVRDHGYYSDTGIVYNSGIFRFRGGTPFFYYLDRPLEGGLGSFHKVTIRDDMTLGFEDYGWRCNDLYQIAGTVVGYVQKTIDAIVTGDGGCVLTYNNDNDSIRIVRFSPSGEVLADRRFDKRPSNLSTYALVTTPDSLGFRIVRMRTDNTFGHSCFTFDSDLNVVDTIVNVDHLSYSPVSCSYSAYFRVNPYSGKAYSNNDWSVPAFNGNPEILQDILMSVYDENMVQLNYTWGIHTSLPSVGGWLYSIDFGSEDDVYMMGGMDGTPPRNFYVAYMDQDLNKYGEIYYVHPSRSLAPQCMAARPQGGCLLFCKGENVNTQESQNCILKITISDFLNVEEAHSHGFAVAMAYPNPGKDVLNIRTGLKDARVEVYDMSGRMVCRQEITENVTSIDAKAWPKGMYVWKVMDKEKEAETGKWVKE